MQKNFGWALSKKCNFLHNFFWHNLIVFNSINSLNAKVSIIDLLYKSVDWFLYDGNFGV